MRCGLSAERRIGGRGVKSQCVRLIWAALFLSLTASATRGQSPTGRPGVHEEAPCPASSKAGGQPVEPPCASSSPPKSAAEQFPFPGEAASKTAKPPSSSTQSGDPAKKFPYPGDPSADRLEQLPRAAVIRVPHLAAQVSMIRARRMHRSRREVDASSRRSNNCRVTRTGRVRISMSPSTTCRPVITRRRICERAMLFTSNLLIRTLTISSARLQSTLGKRMRRSRNTRLISS